MTVAEFRAKVAADRKANPRLRYGQSVWGVLWDLPEGVAWAHANKDQVLDCYYGTRADAERTIAAAVDAGVLEADR